MSLEIRKSSKWWYGVFMVNGQRTVINLGVPITGRRPPKRTMLGDDEFERSRGRAMQAYAKQRKKMDEDRTGEKALTKLAEMKTGREVSFPMLIDLPQHWEAIPRRKTPDGRYAHQCKTTLERFAAFVVERQRGADEFVSVKPETARAFMAAEEARGVSPKTWNDTLKLLRATFRHLHPHLNDGSNPFHGLVTKATETVNREPFTVEELKAITEACAGDDFIRPIIVTGMCTAMRRGDCCMLKWDDVDLKAGFITVKTAKTGETVDIPVFPMLRDELQRALASTGGKGCCFPEQAQMYTTNPDGITWRVKQVLAKALKSPTGPNTPEPSVSTDEVRTKGLAYIKGLGETSKAENMRVVFTAYVDGQNLKEVMAGTCCSRGTVSNYLNELERDTGFPILRGKQRALKTDGLQTERENGKRRASVHDFHSFRVTWITLALAAGVPLELVQRVTGHRTVAVVMKHYFRPGREDFRQALNAAMPQFLVNGHKKSETKGEVVLSPKDEIRRIVEHVTPRTWKKDKARILQLLEIV
ncbi:MAG TPA: site-specific integrase [Candidatus Paceibacterota bacterium]|nr:site-specific integrase [Verrucomicrobiota bacterium]HRY49607.1 site-specific integrase [Candidatus Paceibacterota bacterium]